MVIQFSKELEEALHGDKAVLNYLELVHNDFINGNKTALFNVLQLCAQYQAVIPDWASDEILKMGGRIDRGELKDLNEAFGWEGENLATRKRRARLEQNSNAVLGLLQKHRLAGDSLNADDIFQTVAEELKISRRDVEDIYKLYGQFIKKLPRGNPDNIIHGIFNSQMPFIRRYGRAILKD